MKQVVRSLVVDLRGHLFTSYRLFRIGRPVLVALANDTYLCDFTSTKIVVPRWNRIFLDTLANTRPPFR